MEEKAVESWRQATRFSSPVRVNERSEGGKGRQDVEGERTRVTKRGTRGEKKKDIGGRARPPVCVVHRCLL